MSGSIRPLQKEPSLYLSLFFKNNRNEYYERLSAVRTAGDWEGWLEFFLTGVTETANQAVKTSQIISETFKTDIEKIQSLKRAGITAIKVHVYLQQKAIVSALQTADSLEITIPTARTALKNLKELGIVHDVSGSGKERLYVYTKLVHLLEEGTQPIYYETS